MDKKNKILEDDQEICESVVIHKEVVENTKTKMPDDTSLNELADFFKIFGDSTRVRILWALSLNQMCVCDIAALLNMSQSSVAGSFHSSEKTLEDSCLGFV